MTHEEEQVSWRRLAFTALSVFPALAPIGLWYGTSLGLEETWIPALTVSLLLVVVLLQQALFHPIVVQLLAEMRARRRLSAELVACVEKEQARFGADLHDGLLQTLSGAQFLGKSALRRGELKQGLESVSQCLQEAIDEARRMAHDLCPVVLERRGLHKALQELGRLTTEAGIVCAVELDEGPLPVLPKATQLFRIAQEAVRNAQRHSGASHISVVLRHRRGMLELIVTDNGVGIPNATSTSSVGLGILTMQRRACVIGGELRITPRVPRGTSVTCHVATLEQSSREETL